MRVLTPSSFGGPARTVQKRSTLEGIKKDSSGSKGTIGRTGDVDADGGDSGDGHGTALAHALYNGAVPGGCHVQASMLLEGLGLSCMLR